jgi:hypothetical protein
MAGVLVASTGVTGCWLSLLDMGSLMSDSFPWLGYGQPV